MERNKPSQQTPRESLLEQVRREIIVGLSADESEQIRGLSIDESTFIIDATIEALKNRRLIQPSAMFSYSELGVGEAADRLGVHKNTLGRWEEKGLIRAIKLPTGIRRFRSEDVDQLKREMYDDIARATLEEAE